MDSERAQPPILIRSQLAALLAFVWAALSYAVVLEPISRVFEEPIHANPLTAFGKAVMARMGTVQVVAAALLLAVVIWVYISRGRGDAQIHRLAVVPQAVIALALLVELLMVVSWAVTLWSYSERDVAQLAAAHDVSLWPGDWHLQIAGGTASLASAAALGVAAFFANPLAGGDRSRSGTTR
ncbi:MAG: hypothetical protein M3Z65_00815 [Chloroflexota bacterium]|nr:hypothetical protein [Chloroflexota bacterium]